MPSGTDRFSDVNHSSVAPSDDLLNRNSCRLITSCHWPSLLQVILQWLSAPFETPEHSSPPNPWSCSYGLCWSCHKFV